jgi:hypothetical protein
MAKYRVVCRTFPFGGKTYRQGQTIVSDRDLESEFPGQIRTLDAEGQLAPAKSKRDEAAAERQAAEDRERKDAEGKSPQPEPAKQETPPDQTPPAESPPRATGIPTPRRHDRTRPEV